MSYSSEERRIKVLGDFLEASPAQLDQIDSLCSAHAAYSQKWVDTVKAFHKLFGDLVDLAKRSEDVSPVVAEMRWNARELALISGRLSKELVAVSRKSQTFSDDLARILEE